VELLGPLSFAEAGPIVGVLTDIDDTLTTEGAITADAVHALAQLHAAGIHVIPVTGRPVGWSEPFALQWPVDAIVAENGAVALVPRQGRIEKLYQQDTATRAANFSRMRQVAHRLVREIPGAVLAHDSAGRETDIAIDHSEFHHLAPAAIDRAVHLMQSEGMNATVSSIHINGWYGDHNKWSGARWIVRELFGRNLEAEAGRWVYVGDSTNDVLMFEHFPHSVGVANIRRFEAQLSHPPRYITASERGAGFAEVARAVLAARA
jgi:HAD superfamily hydrolase (TIGR01484 family)